MRKNRKQREKKNIFEDNSEEDNEPKQPESGLSPDKKADWTNEKYDAAKLEENEMYINKKEKQEEHVWNKAGNADEMGKSKKKRTAKKKKLFDSDDDQQGSDTDGRPTKGGPETQQQPVQHIRTSVMKTNEAAVKQQQSNDQELEDQDNEEYTSKMKEITEKESKEKQKEMYDEPTSFSELYEKAGNDRQKMKRLLYEPIPKGYKVVSTFKRVPNAFSETYQLLLDDERAVLFCENQRGAIGANYYISMTKQMDKKSSAYLGKLRGNAAGSTYHIYDAGDQPSKTQNRKHWRTSMGKVEYENNFMGMNGPRKLNVVIPSAETLEDLDGFKLSESEDIANLQPPLAESSETNNPSGTKGSSPMR